MNTYNVCRVLAALAIAMPSVAHAQTEDDWAADFEATVASDYRYRGLSLSGHEPQVSGSVTLSHATGFYGNLWASNVDLGSGADSLETDLVVGWSTAWSDLTLDVGTAYYAYPGNSHLNYIELQSSISHRFGPATLQVGAAYSPSQKNIGGTDNTYVYLSGDFPLGDDKVVAHGSFGLENGAFGDNKRDWKLGLSYDLGKGRNAKLEYIDTAGARSPMGDAALVGTLAWSF